MFNLRFILSVLLIITTLYLGVVSGGPALQFFLNTHALVLVFLGTLCVFVFSNSFNRIISIFKVLKKVAIEDFEQDRSQIIYRLYYLSSVVKNNYPKQYFQNVVDHPFLADSLKLLDVEQLDGEDFKKTIDKRLETIIDNYSEDSDVLAALAKYPPAMGLLGATSGMISMMMNIGSGDKGSIGSAMASALVATLWGIAVSNFILLPLADLVSRMNTANIANRTMIVDAFDLIKNKRDPAVVLEMILSYIPFKERRTVSDSCTKWYKNQISRMNP